jgi:hypothetical protein
MRRVAMVFAVALTGCATQFVGSPKFDDGPARCRASCEEWKMDLAGMVKMGEYSDGCICLIRPGDAAPAATSPPRADASRVQAGVSGAAIAAAAGVYLQMQAAAAQQQAFGNGPPQSGPTPHPYVPHSPIGSPGWRPGLP